MQVVQELTLRGGGDSETGMFGEERSKGIQSIGHIASGWTSGIMSQLKKSVSLRGVCHAKPSGGERRTIRPWWTFHPLRRKQGRSFRLDALSVHVSNWWYRMPVKS